MMTRELLRQQMAISEANEEQTYKDLTLSLFRELQDPLKNTFDQALTATQQFTTITASVLKAGQYGSWHSPGKRFLPNQFWV